ncbi:hypothetical protein, variant 1 [Cladophialophora immunda]|uniref:Uncharacterized protein n=1 Tax=Cladophialophora immunda TaxID=569365 RepID=A0A0D2ADV0_9EURO|nr:hypothetical protein, variant 1 [Cladophialophora immunda]KIW23067.1 hypothetical protein, variant 1 [Cladophialophora immunda]
MNLALTLASATPHRFNRPAKHYSRVFLDNSQLQDHIANRKSARTLDSFRTIVEAQKTKLFSIVEQFPLDKGGDILFTESEITVNSPKFETVQKMPKNHIEIATFGSDTEQSFLDLCTWLRTIFGDLIDQDTTWDMQFIPLTARQPGCYDSIPFEGNSDNYSQRWINTIKRSGVHYRDKWFHFPTNHESEVTGAGAIALGLPLGLGDVPRARKDLPHARYVLPSTCVSMESWGADADTIFFRLVLPYLHWDTMAGASRYKKWLKWKQNPNSLDSNPFPVFASLPEPFKSYHPRRTLDQFYYSRLEHTDERDNDQVVSKQTKASPTGAKMIMVDQLWLGLWVSAQHPALRSPAQLNFRKDRAIILTSFPDTAYARDDDPPREKYCAVDIRQQVFKAIEDGAIRGPTSDEVPAADCAVEVLRTALLGMLSYRKDWSLDFMELFREALGQITEQHSKNFRQYTTSIGSRGKCSEQEEIKFKVMVQTGKMEEIRLSLEVADIIDELNMLRKLFVEQIEVLQRASIQVDEVRAGPGIEHAPWLESFGKTLRELLGKVEDYLFRAKSMIEDGERAQKDILVFLDIQQREENIQETRSLNQQALFAAKQAISAQEQADATDAQNQILFIFTIVTIVFTPLSFLASYFALADKHNGTIFGASAGVWVGLGLTGLLYFFWSRRGAKKSRIEELAGLKMGGYLPDRLLDSNRKLSEEVDKKVEELVRKAEEEEGERRKKIV